MIYKKNSNWMYSFYPYTILNINDYNNHIIKKIPQITINNAASIKGTKLLNNGHNYDTFISNNNIFFTIISIIFIFFIIIFL